MTQLFTVGHSSHTIDHLVGLLRQHAIALVVDVRSSPYSKYSPQFNKDPLEKALRRSGIDYLFQGNELGARRSEENCYVDGQARYDQITALPAFRRGMDRLLAEMPGRRVSLLCSEADPITCHRTVLICRELQKQMPTLSIAHILADGSIETHEQVSERLVALHKLVPELFGELSCHTGLIERAYDLQAEKIAYTATAAEA